MKNVRIAMPSVQPPSIKNYREMVSMDSVADGVISLQVIASL
jgi:hypothetical protein